MEVAYKILIASFLVWVIRNWKPVVSFFIASILFVSSDAQSMALLDTTPPRGGYNVTRREVIYAMDVASKRSDSLRIMIDSNKITYADIGGHVFNYREGNNLMRNVNGSVSLVASMLNLRTTWDSISNTPTIPTNNNQLTNGSGYITTVPAQSWASITGKPTIYTEVIDSATTTGGVATFYLTNTKLSGGTAVFSSVTYINPIVNDAAGNYTYGWTLTPDKKTLTVNAKVASNTAVIALLGISVLGSTVNVPNGTKIYLLAKGN